MKYSKECRRTAISVASLVVSCLSNELDAVVHVAGDVQTDVAGINNDTLQHDLLFTGFILLVITAVKSHRASGIEARSNNAGFPQQLAMTSS
jgi:hypothetical protein